MAGFAQFAGLGYSLAAGSLTTLSPCVFPILPLVIGGAVQANRLAPVAMGAGMALSFAAIGMVLGLLGPALGFDGDSVRTAGAALLIAFGLVMLIPALDRRFSALMTPLASSAHSASAKLKPDSCGARCYWAACWGWSGAPAPARCWVRL